VAQWHTLSPETVLEKLNTDKTNGLAADEAGQRIKDYGPNEIIETGRRTAWNMVLDQFRDFMVIILLIAALISGILGEIADSIVIMAIVILNAVLGVVQESKAEKSLAALKKMAAPNARVLRDGRMAIVPAREIVPGDIIYLEAGDLAPVDGRLIEAASLKVEEAALTGESIPVEKNVEPVSGEEVPIGDRKNMVFMASTVIYGRGILAAVETGMNTEVGKIANLIQRETETQTPLQKRLTELGKKLGTAAVVMSFIIFVLGIIKGEKIFEMFLTAVSLAVAVIPEGLPATVTVVLAVGVQRMIKRNAIIRKLPAVETLGAATIICSDKTGTLTQNKMTVQEIWSATGTSQTDRANIGTDAQFVLRAAALANDAQLHKQKVTEEDGPQAVGDPTETAIIIAAAGYGLVKHELEKESPRIYEIPFDSDRKLMITVHRTGDDLTVFVKGAPDVLLEKCGRQLKEGIPSALGPENLAEIRKQNRKMAEQGLRVLGVAYKKIPELSEKHAVELEKGLIFAGLIGMIDPPREEAFEAVRKTREAGIRPCMITGDYEITAKAIAQRLGIMEEGDGTISGQELDRMSDEELAGNVTRYSVFSRVSPEHKLKIVKAFQQNNEVVAMTGDGVNDAPALKKADIGAAMGITGTDVAKQASDMILTDDNYATLVAAVEEGRNIYANIKKSIYYLLSCNAGEILVLFLALFFGWPRPLLPIQILWVNLVTDSLPGLALGLEPPEKDVMKRPPRNPGERVLNKDVGLQLLIEGIIIAAVTLFAFYIGLAAGVAQARTMAFLTLSFSQKAHAFNKRSDTESLWSIGWFSNKYLVTGVLVSTLIQLSVVFVPFLKDIFRVTALSGSQWLTVAVMSLAPLAVIETTKLINRLRRKLTLRPLS